MKSRVIAALLLVAMGSVPRLDGAVSLGGDETTNTAQIVIHSENVSCLQWRPIGICVWLTCTAAGCSVDTSVKVKHYAPDAVVSAYQNTGESPWIETRAYAQPNAMAQDGGTNKEGSTVVNETALLFKNVDVIGSPGMLWIQALSSTGYFCDPTTTPYIPYMLSTLDPNWRSPVIETAWTLRNIHRHVRSGLSIWAGIYPRIGFIHQGHDYKAGAVAAQRAADITTRRHQPHIYWPMRVTNPRKGQWPPGAVVEGDPDTHLWQQLIPETQATECRVFPDISDQTSGASDPFAGRVNQNAGYAFNLWRPYRCCERNGANLIFHTGN